MTEANEKFTSEKGGKDDGNARDEMLKKLAAAHDAFFELQKHLQEGTKFYNDLTQLLVTFQNKVWVSNNNYCVVSFITFFVGGQGIKKEKFLLIPF